MLKFRQNLILDNICRRQDMAHSPLTKAIFDMEEKRSSLFLDRRRIPSRKAKFLIALGLICQCWGFKKLMEIKQFMKNRDQDIKKLHRRSAPFLQAMNDLRYTAIEDRKTMIIDSIFANKSKQEIDSLRQRFYQTDIWVPNVDRYAYMMNKTYRNVKPYNELFFSRYMHGYDKFNI